jgi:hypothetical protein
MAGMKLLAAAVVASCFALAPSAARAQDDDLPTDTPATRAGEAWMKAMLAPGGSVAAPSKDRPLEYLVDNGQKACRALKAGGTAKDFKTLAKLKSCAVASYKAIGESSTTQWFQLPSAATVLASFPSKYGKKIRAAAKGATIVEGHHVGDGLNMDVYLALDADNHVRAIWLTEEGFE